MMTATLHAPQGVPTTCPTLSAADPTAFAAMFEAMRRRLQRVAQRIVRCPEAAADVVQDAAIAALGALPRFEGRAAPATWLHRIVVNAALMHLRRERSRREAALDDAPLPVGPILPDPSEVVAERDACDRLRDCLAELPDAPRNVLESFYIQGLDTAGTAAVLGVTPNAAKIRLHRARRALRDRFEGRRPAAKPELPSADDAPLFVLSRSAAPTRAAG